MAIISVLLPTIMQSTVAYADNTKTNYGITVSNCELDFIGENYCEEGRIKQFVQAMHNFDPNFANDKMLYIYKSVEEGELTGNKPSSSLFRYPVYSMVLMDKNNKTVTPFIWTFMPADAPINKKGDFMEFIFDKESNEFCYKGYLNSMLDYFSYEANPSQNARRCFYFNETSNRFSDISELKW